MEENFNGIKVEIYRSNRKTISIELKPGRLIVRAPRRMSAQEIHAFIHKKKAWIEKHHQQMLERQPEKDPAGRSYGALIWILKKIFWKQNVRSTPRCTNLEKQSRR